MKNTTGIVRILFFSACSNAQPEIFAHTLSQCRLEAGGKFLEGFFFRKSSQKPVTTAINPAFILITGNTVENWLKIFFSKFCRIKFSITFAIPKKGLVLLFLNFR